VCLVELFGWVHTNGNEFTEVPTRHTPRPPPNTRLCWAGVQGEKAMWPVLATLQCHCRVELELADSAATIQRQTRVQDPGARSHLSPPGRIRAWG
jgi:hypothetical protein